MSKVNQHDFSRVPSVEVERSVLNRSCSHRTTFGSSYLVPFFVDEILPGDTVNLRHHVWIRMLQALEVPILDNIYFETFYFFVPNRLVWDNWQRFCGERTNPDDDIDFSIPQIRYPNSTAPSLHSICDFFGLPVEPQVVSATPNLIEHNALPFRAYALIYNEWFRNQNLIDSVYIPTGDGPDILNDGATPPLNYFATPRKRCKRHDYFTSCLPWPQRGDDIEIPLGATAPVIGNAQAIRFYDGTDGGYMCANNTPGDTERYARMIKTASGQVAKGDVLADTADWTLGRHAMGLTTDPASSGMVVDLSTAVAATVNEWRYAIALQRFQEREARGGSRYTEILRSFWHVISPDQRLQRPEYLGGSSDMIQISPVNQTAPTTGQPLAKLGAFAYGSSSHNGFSKSFVEHGYVIGICNVRADLTYQQGVNRMFSRKTRYDFFWGPLAHLGEQEVLNKEINYQNDPGWDNLVWGYQGRYDEYRYKPSMITGQLRSKATNPLDVWHLSQELADDVELNQAFIEDAVPLNRIMAIEDVNTQYSHWLMDAYFSYKHTRVMPTYAVPGMMDHF